MHTGCADRARPRIRRLLQVLENEVLDYLVTNAAGCGSALKTAHHLFEEGTADHSATKNLTSRVRDALELVAESPSRVPRSAVKVRVAYLDACHLMHGQGLTSLPRRLLGSVPQLELLEVDEAGLCCGSAGLYNLMQPEAASALGARKASHIAEIRPDMVAVANPGCALQIQAHLPDIPVVHPIQILDRSLEGGV